MVDLQLRTSLLPGVALLGLLFLIQVPWANPRQVGILKVGLGAEII